MKIQIDIENCQGCPYSWSHVNHDGQRTWVCDKLQDNVGSGDTIHKKCPLKGEQDG